VSLDTDRRPAAEPEAERLSTQPPPPPPVFRHRGLLVLLRNSWRQLTSMRTALLLLFLLALAAVPGSVLPQRGLNPIKVDDFYHAHPALAPLLDRLSLFDVFAAPWFGAIYLLLFVSLAGCLVPRVRLHLRALRAQPPAAPSRLSRLPTSARWGSEAEPAAAVEAAREEFRRRRFRVRVREEDGGRVSLAAEKGYLRESGNLVFHLALLLLLLGVALGGLFGYKGTVLVTEGDGFANVLPQYDNFRPGRMFTPSDLAPFSFTLESFSATYQPSGQPRTFDAHIRFTAAPGAPARAYDVRVNHPLDVDGTKLYLIGHGYAAHVVVRGADGAVALDTAVPFLPENQATLTSNGAIAVPDARPAQLGFTGFLTPTTVVTPNGLSSSFPAAINPRLTLLAYRGDLGMDSGIPRSVYSLDTTHLTRVATASLAPGQTWTLPGGGSLTFVGLKQWATFQTTHDPGRGMALVAAVLVIAGLLVSLRVRRRRVWVRASPGEEEGGRTVVEVAGLARSDRDTFAEEFDDLVTGLRRRTARPVEE
jgi:cytochrome c biogenesis protein